jgi:hypothetical protein
MACALAGYEGEDTPSVIPFAAALGRSMMRNDRTLSARCDSPALRPRTA